MEKAIFSKSVTVSSRSGIDKVRFRVYTDCEMGAVFSYVIGLGAAVMMPVIFTVLGVCVGIRFSKALKSGLLVGVGFVGR